MDHIVPYNELELFMRTYIASRLPEHKGDKPISVKPFAFKGKLYVATGAMYGPIGMRRMPFCEAYELTTSNPRTTEKYGYKGVPVSMRGTTFWLNNPIRIHATLPSTRPVSFNEARAFDESNREFGWRALSFKGIEPTWRYAQGHPVTIYKSTGSMLPWHASLIWKFAGNITEVPLDNDIPLTDAPEYNSTLPAEQMSLF